MTVKYLILFIGVCTAAPADNPIKVDLPVYDQPKSSSDVVLAQALEAENHPGIQTAKSAGIGSLISNKFQGISTALSSGHQQTIDVGGIFSAPVTTREDALLEKEDFGSKTLSIKENIQNVVAGIFQPKPIVDTIREEDKYGNTGDKFNGAGRAVVGAASGVSNLVNSVLEIPGNIFKKITRAASEKLNNFGGRLIGLN